MIVMLKRHAAGPDPVTIINTQALRNTCGPSRSRTGFWDIKRGPPDRSAPTLDRNERLRIKRIVAFVRRTLAYPNTSLNDAQGGTKSLGESPKTGFFIGVAARRGFSRHQGEILSPCQR